MTPFFSSVVFTNPLAVTKGQFNTKLRRLPRLDNTCGVTQMTPGASEVFIAGESSFSCITEKTNII